jgi:ribokinase
VSLVAEVLVAGSYNAGLTIYGDRFPRPGETVLGGQFEWGPGGKGANQAIGLKRLGIDVCFAVKLGSDVFGEHARRVLAREGLPEQAIMTGAGPTGIAFILVGADGQNAIMVAPGANLELAGADVAALGDDVLGSGHDCCRIALVQLECRTELAVDIGHWARQRGARCVLNTAPARPLPPESLPLFDILTPNETELAALTRYLDIPGDSVEERALGLTRYGVGDVIVTLGERGAVWASEQGVQRFDAYDTEVVDTTGAGDAFTAGLVAGLAAGESMAAAIDQGCRAGAYCVAHAGVIDGLATVNELKDFSPHGARAGGT